MSSAFDCFRGSVMDIINENIGLIEQSTMECGTVKCSRINAVFTESNLEGSEFVRDNLSGAAFDESDMRGAGFLQVNLAGGSFTESDLSGVEITDCKLDGMTINGIAVTELLKHYNET